MSGTHQASDSSVEDVTRWTPDDSEVVFRHSDSPGLLSTDGHRTHNKEYSGHLVNETSAIPAAHGLQEGSDNQGSNSKDQIVFGNITSKGSSNRYPVPESNPGDLSESPIVHHPELSPNSNLENLIGRIVELKLSTAQYVHRSEIESLRIEHRTEVESLRKEVEACHNEIQRRNSQLIEETQRRVCAEQNNKHLEEKVQQLEDKNKRLLELLRDQIDSYNPEPQVEDEHQTLYFGRR